MSCYSKEKIERRDYNNVCKSHSARSDRELYRICPSKLSKRELEDLYFALLENNLELKRTINGQQDKIKGLATKVQRMTTAQKSLQAKEMKECCVGTKSVVSEQMESIAELKRANARMAERIRSLNMRLCSAKQFYKRAPMMTTTRCLRCAAMPATTTSTPKKHDCSSKPSEQLKISVSCQNLDRDTVSMKSAQTETRELERVHADLPCDENKCRTTMEEFKQKIVHLQEELSQTHGEYSSRISRLENEVSEVRKENLRVRSERNASEHELQHFAKRTNELYNGLKTADAKCADLSTQLSIEKRKVAELETQLKSAKISDRVNKTIEDHLTTKTKTKEDLSTSKKETKKAAADITMCDCDLPTENKWAESTPTKDVKLTCECLASPEGQSEDIILKKDPKGDHGSGTDSRSIETTPKMDSKITCICSPRPEGQSDDLMVKKKLKCICACPPQPKSEFADSMLTKIGSPAFEKNTDLEYSPVLSRNLASHRITEFSPIDGKITKASDDSGYIEANKSLEINDEAGLQKMNRELMRRVVELQSQVDSLKISGAHELPAGIQVKQSETTETSNYASTSRRSKDKPTAFTAEFSGIKPGSPKLEDRDPNKQEYVFFTPKLLPAEDRGSNKFELELSKQKIDDRDSIRALLSKQRLAMIEDYESNKTNETGKTKPTGEPLSSKTELIFGVPKTLDDRVLSDKTDLGSKQKSPETIERKISFSELVTVEQSSAPSDDLRPSSTGSASGKTNTTPNEERRQSTTGSASNKLNTTTNENAMRQYNPRAESGHQLLTIDEQNKTDLIPAKLKMPSTEERRPSSSDPKSATKEDPSQNKAILPCLNVTPTAGALAEDKTELERPMAECRRYRTLDDDPTGKKEACENCYTCTIEKECELHPYHGKNDQRCDDPATKITQGIKNDRHNSLQIPGPIPVTDNNNKDWKKHIFRHNSDSKKKDSQKNKNGHQKKEMVSKNATEKVQKEKENLVVDVPAVQNITKDRPPTITEETRRESKEAKRNLYQPSQGSIDTQNMKWVENKRLTSRDSHDRVAGQNISNSNYYRHSEEVPNVPLHDHTNERGTQVERELEQKNQKDQATAVQVENQYVNPSLQKRRQSSISEQGTYTVGSIKLNRSTSPDNTEFEISSMTDLPSERDPKSPVKTRPLSPGEDKMTTTYTDSYTSPVTTYTLSEGEMPAATTRRISRGERDDRKTDHASTRRESAQQTQKMEATLQAISEELARCKNLIQCQRPQEPGVRQESIHSQTEDDTIELRRAVAVQSIGDVYTPKCVFTLHIGTVVLSDEAVFNSRNKTLVLTWKFYDQNTAMTRMRAGRVILFDFSTEYDIKITDEFLSYMKHAEMPIVICELDKQDEPFASCTLPLRDALLHTNRRADISLALVAGPQMINARATNSAAADVLDAGDEVGVIDVWCMLRADGKLLPVINRAIARPSPPAIKMGPRSSRVMQQVYDDDRSIEFMALDMMPEKRNGPQRMGEQNDKCDYRDLISVDDPACQLNYTLGNSKAAAVSVAELIKKDQFKQADDYVRLERCWGSSILKLPNTIEVDAATQTANSKAAQTYDPTKYPSPRRQSCSGVKMVPPQTSNTTLPQEEPEHDDSNIIVNEVVAKIKSPGDMKQALEKSCQHKELTRLPKKEEDLASQAQSSMSSLRSVMARLHKAIPRNNNQEMPRRASLLQSMRRVSKSTLEHQPKLDERTEHPSDLEIYKKYENISKMIASNKGEASKKSVKILPGYTQEETPQKDTTEEQPEEKGETNKQNLDVTILWLALNEECEAMVNPRVQRVYVAYSFLGRNGAELETPISLPKPKHYVDKCYFNFRKTFELEDSDLPALGHMARCRAVSRTSEDARDCIVFSVVSEPPEDPLGLESCEDIGYASLYLGDLLAYSADSPGYTEVIPVRTARGGAAVCGVLAVRLDGLDVVRRCLQLSSSQRSLTDWSLPLRLSP